MKTLKTFLKNCWESKAVRNLGNVIVSVLLSSILIKNGVPPQDATTIGQAAGAAVVGQQ